MTEGIAGQGVEPQLRPMRLFFALWPEPSVRARLVAHQRGWAWQPPARPTQADKLHLTLLFMDGVPADGLDDAIAAGEAAARDWSDFDLVLDCPGVWRRGGIAHLAPDRPPAALGRLHDRLAAAARERGLPFDGRAYAPHVTLARRAEAMPLPEHPEPVHWAARGFCLVRSELGTGRYRVLKAWRNHAAD